MNTPTSRIPKNFDIKKNYGLETTDPAKISFHHYGKQGKKGGREYGKTIAHLVKNPLGAKTLDHLLDHPEKIPEKWRGLIVVFWGTIYTAKASMSVPVIGEGGKKSEIKNIEYDVECVRFLYHTMGEWKSDFFELDEDFGPMRVSAEIKQYWYTRLLDIWHKIRSMWTTY